MSDNLAIVAFLQSRFLSVDGLDRTFILPND